jgi:hypothetical protein
MANTDKTLIQLKQIDEFMLKYVNFNIELSEFNANKLDAICVSIVNASQLGTLLSRIEQENAHSIPNLMDYVKYFDPTKNKFLILSSN